MTKVTICSCKHDFQDKEYGKGKRLFNVKTKSSPTKGKCTVCGTEKTL